MYLMIDENDNCSPDERVFPTHGQERTVKRLHVESPLDHSLSWCDVVAVNSDETFPSAKAVLIDDSSDGTAWLIYGGEWGIRLRPEKSTNMWALADKSQWGLPFIVLDKSGAAIEFD